MFEFIIKENPKPSNNSTKIVMDHVDSNCFKNTSMIYIDVLKKFAERRNMKFGINEFSDLIFICDDDDVIIPIIDSIYSKIKFEDKLEFPNMVFIYTNFFNIPLLLRHNIFIKSIKIESFNERVLLGCIFCNKPTVVPQDVLILLDTFGYLIRNHLIQNGILKPTLQKILIDRSPQQTLFNTTQKSETGIVQNKILFYK